MEHIRWALTLKVGFSVKFKISPTYMEQTHAEKKNYQLRCTENRKKKIFTTNLGV